MSKIFSKEAAKESILYNYKHGFSGFAAVLTPCQAKLIAGVTILVNCKLCFLSFESEFSFLISNLIYIFLCWKLNADSPGVVHVIPNRILNLHTTRSWNFLEVNSHIRNGILSKSQSGIGSIIGIMDTGQDFKILYILQSILDQITFYLYCILILRNLAWVWKLQRWGYGRCPIPIQRDMSRRRKVQSLPL